MIFFKNFSFFVLFVFEVSAVQSPNKSNFILIGDPTMAPNQEKLSPKMRWGEALPRYLSNSDEG